MEKKMAPLIKAPEFMELPEKMMTDFYYRDFAVWYKKADNDRRLTLINNYMKMKERGLWDYVKGPAQSPEKTEVGRLEFFTHDIHGFKDNLSKRNDFSNPNHTWFTKPRWNSREHTRDFSLEFKSFNGWEENRIQAHIDPIGLTLDQAFKHLRDFGGHQDVNRISAGLKSKGFGKDLNW